MTFRFFDYFKFCSDILMNYSLEFISFKTFCEEYENSSDKSDLNSKESIV